ETRGRDLLHGAAPPVAVRILLVPRRILAALAGVRLAAEAVHRDRERLVRFLTDRSIRHRSRGESLHEALDRFDFVDRDRLRGRLQLEQPAERRVLAILIVHQLRVLLEDGVLAASRRMLQLEDGVWIEQVVLAVAAPLIFAAPFEIGLSARTRRKRARVPLERFVGDDVEADAADL